MTITRALLFAILVAHWWFGEKAGRGEWLALAASLTGVLLITRPAFLFGGAASDIPPWQALIALGGAAFSGSAYATIRRMPMERPEVVVLYLPLMSTTAFLASYGLALSFRRYWAAHAAFMLGTALALVEPIAVRLIFFYTSAGEAHWIYDVVGIALVGTVLSILIVVSRDVPRARSALVALLVLFGTLSAGWFTLARTDGWARFARWFVDLPLT